MVSISTNRAILMNLDLTSILISTYLLLSAQSKGLFNNEYPIERAFSLLLAFFSFISGYIGCTGVWFKSKIFISAHIAIVCLIVPSNILVEMFLLWEKQNFEVQTVLTIILIVIGVPQVFLSRKYLVQLRNFGHTSSSAAGINQGMNGGNAATYRFEHVMTPPANIRSPVLYPSSPIFSISSIESLASSGHEYNGNWIPAHIHVPSNPMIGKDRVTETHV